LVLASQNAFLRRSRGSDAGTSTAAIVSMPPMRARMLWRVRLRLFFRWEKARIQFDQTYPPLIHKWNGKPKPVPSVNDLAVETRGCAASRRRRKKCCCDTRTLLHPPGWAHHLWWRRCRMHNRRIVDSWVVDPGNYMWLCLGATHGPHTHSLSRVLAHERPLLLAVDDVNSFLWSLVCAACLHNPLLLWLCRLRHNLCHANLWNFDCLWISHI